VEAHEIEKVDEGSDIFRIELCRYRCHILGVVLEQFR
jgi:hypothetical protein